MVSKALAAQDVDAAVYVAWVPMLRAQEKHVERATRVVTDGRAAHYWDGHGVLLSGFQQTLSIPEPAWDVYMVFAPGSRWDADAPPVPDFWMHQLGGRVDGPLLDAHTFAQRARALEKETTP